MASTSRCTLGVKHRRRSSGCPAARGRELLKVEHPQHRLARQCLLVKRHVGVLDVAALELPTLEPRGAVLAELLIHDRPLRVVGMHLDLSGLWRRRQMRRSSSHRRPAAEDADGADGRHQRMARRRRLPADLEPDYHIAPTGPSFHARRPVAALDRIIVDKRASGSRRPACT
jgi:endonuclease/exonuclease/phosphatase family metal-dependent hydrolase